MKEWIDSFAKKRKYCIVCLRTKEDGHSEDCLYSQLKKERERTKEISALYERCQAELAIKADYIKRLEDKD